MEAAAQSGEGVITSAGAKSRRIQGYSISKQNQTCVSPNRREIKMKLKTKECAPGL